MRNHVCLFMLILFPGCGVQTQDNDTVIRSLNEPEEYKQIADIPVPPGYTRINAAENSPAAWLRNIKLKKDKRVFLYNGLLKSDQSIQFAVLDEKTGSKDLQQCADAIIRLRAEYFFSTNKYDSIHFTATDGTVLSFRAWRAGARFRLSGNKLVQYSSRDMANDVQADFENYLETVFNYAGTYSLALELKPVSDLDKIQGGDIFVKPGFPGHAMIVMDVCINKDGRKMFMLAQGYMPAQDMHIVKNKERAEYSPWYQIGEEKNIITPSWEFTASQLKRWK